MIPITTAVAPQIEMICLFISVLLFFFILYHRLRRQQQTQLHTGIEQLKLLRLLLADFQLHRGLSTALLSGDTSLTSDLHNTRQRLEKCIQQASALDTAHHKQWFNLIQQWQHIHQNNTAKASSNLLSHHRLIRHTIYLIEDIAHELNAANSSHKLDYLNYIWHEVVQTAEWTGQARALGTSMAASQSSSAAQRVRLRFLHSKIKQLSSTAFSALETRNANHLNVRQSQQTVNSFLLCLEQELLNCDYPHIEAKHYFEQATQAINELLGMIDTALKDLQTVTKRI